MLKERNEALGELETIDIPFTDWLQHLDHLF